MNELFKFVSAHPLLIKGTSKHAVGKKSSKVCKFDLDENSVALFGPIPPKGSTIFDGLCFLLTCTEMPPVKVKILKTNYSFY